MKFAIAGAGNAASHFCNMLIAHGHQLTQVFSRKDNGFAQSFQAARIDSPRHFSNENELVIVAVSDDAIALVASEIPLELFTIHVSGMTPMDALPHQHKGVVWPVMSLSANISIPYEGVPFLIEGANSACTNRLLQIFTPVSSNIMVTDSTNRAKAHVAAVFANNFVNHLLDLSDVYLKASGLSIDLLKPMIHHQFEKIATMSPHDAQTGPAVRADFTTIGKHLEMLSSEPHLKEMYILITNSIMTQYHGKKL